MKKTIILLLAIIFTLTLGMVGGGRAQAATCSAGGTYYIRAGSTASASNSNYGKDWANAYPNFNSVSWCRGATYYVAAGSYKEYDFNTPESGSALITIKKATSGDHGTGTGWSSSYAGQALFTGSLSFSRKYYVIDGQTRNENDWADINSYGFRLNPGAGQSGIYMQDQNNPPGAGYITVKYVDIGANPGTVCYDNGNRPCPDAAVYFLGVYNVGTNLTISHCHIHNVELPAQLDRVDNGTFEYNYIGPSWHKEAIRGQDHANNWIIKNNVFVDNGYYDGPNTGLTGDIAAWGTPTPKSFDNWEIYGNVFWNTPAGQDMAHDVGIIVGGLLSGTSEPSTYVAGWKVYNNVFAGISGLYAAVRINGKNDAENNINNNIWYNIGSGTTIECVGSSCSNNWCYKANSDNGMPLGLNCSKLKQTWPTTVLGSADPFVNSSAGNFNLKNPAQVSGLSPVNNGLALGSGYDPIDMNGIIRGSDGRWDIGAYEYKGGVVPPTPTPTPVITPTPTPIITPTPTPIITPSPTPVPNGIYYIRAGATGRGDGSSWTNAYPNLAAVNWQHGLTYYLADGTYPSYTFNLPAGTSYATIKKATAADHGPAADWSSSFGDGQAVLGPLTFNSSYLKIDGAARNERNWSDQNSYGIKIAGVQNGDKAVLLNNGASFIQIQYVAITSPGTSQSTSISSASDGVYAISGSHDLVFSRDSFDTFNRAPFVLGGLNNVTLEYSYIAGDNYNPTVHAEALADEGSSNFTIRYNTFEQINGTGYIVELERGNTNSTANNWNIYGNIFRNSKGDGVGRGVVTVINGQIAKNWNFYNNTTDNVHGYCSGFELQEAGVSSSGLQNYNNLWLNSDSAQMNCVDTPTVRAATGYNYFVNTSHDNELNMQTGTADPFISAAGGDYRLRAATMAGKTLAAPFDQDVTGTSRGADGVWDRGAQEFVAATPTPTPTFVPVVTPTPTPTPPGCISLTKNLSLGQGEISGSDSSDVTALQQFLAKYGYLAKVNPTGFFGSRTQEAVIAFQKTFLSAPNVTGTVGQLTRNKIYNLTCH